MSIELSSTGLIETQPLVLSPELAVAIGDREAIFVQQLQYWINKAINPAENMSGWRDDEGNIWIYNTLDEWSILNFPFWSKDQVGRVIRSVEKKGVILSCMPLSKSGNRRKYYRIDYQKLAEILHPVRQKNERIVREYMESQKKGQKTQVVDFEHNANLQHADFKHNANSHYHIADSHRLTETTTEITSSSSYSPRAESTRSRYQPMNPDWMPSQDLLDRIHRTKGIPTQFALDQVCEFVTYWVDSGKELLSWDTKFIQSVIRSWEHHKANPPKVPVIPLPPRTQIPDDFALTPNLEKTCQQIAPELINDVGNIFNRFVSYARDKGKTSHDWLSAWAAWLTREIEHHRKGDKYKTAHERKAEYHQRMMAANADTSWADGLGDFA